jgi:cytochrome c553
MSKHISEEQLRYARILDVGVKAGLAILLATFLVYLSGLLPPQVPLEALPRLWTLPVADFLRESAVQPGWLGLARFDVGDMLALSGIALLSGLSFPCLALLARDYARRRDWWYLAITVSLIAVPRQGQRQESKTAMKISRAITAALVLGASHGLPAIAAEAAGDAAAGQAKTSMCIGCHAIGGYKTAFPEVYSVPKIGGQHAAYIVKALQEYKTGNRTHPSMRAIAASLSDKDMADLAAYYAADSVKSAAK